MSVDVTGLDAAGLKARIEKEATVRAECWRLGLIDDALQLTSDLDAHWELWRTRRAQEAGVDQPKFVQYRPVSETDPIDRFVQTRCVVENNVTAPTSAVHSALVAWAKDEGEGDVVQISAMRLTQELQRRGIERDRTKHTRLYSGLRLAA